MKSKYTCYFKNFIICSLCGMLAFLNINIVHAAVFSYTSNNVAAFNVPTFTEGEVVNANVKLRMNFSLVENINSVRFSLFNATSVNPTVTGHNGQYIEVDCNFSFTYNSNMSLSLQSDLFIVYSNAFANTEVFNNISIISQSYTGYEPVLRGDIWDKIKVGVPSLEGVNNERIDDIIPYWYSEVSSYNNLDRYPVMRLIEHNSSYDKPIIKFLNGPLPFDSISKYLRIRQSTTGSVSGFVFGGGSMVYLGSSSSTIFTGNSQTYGAWGDYIYLPNVDYGYWVIVEVSNNRDEDVLFWWQNGKPYNDSSSGVIQEDNPLYHNGGGHNPGGDPSEPGGDDSPTIPTIDLSDIKSILTWIALTLEGYPGFTELYDFLRLQTDRIVNAINNISGGNSIDYTDILTGEEQNPPNIDDEETMDDFHDYKEIEDNYIDEFEDSIDNIDTDIDYSRYSSGFSFIGTQLQNIYLATGEHTMIFLLPLVLLIAIKILGMRK